MRLFDVSIIIIHNIHLNSINISKTIALHLEMSLKSDVLSQSATSLRVVLARGTKQHRWKMKHIALLF